MKSLYIDVNSGLPLALKQLEEHYKTPYTNSARSNTIFKIILMNKIRILSSLIFSVFLERDRLK